KTIDLVDPYCILCKKKPVKKSSKHYFFKLSSFSKFLEKWIKENKNLQPEIKNFVLNWIKDGLDDWDISRDGPYFGFNIPGEKDKYYYVWLDAPIGYISSTKNYCDRNGGRWEDYWKKGKVYHLIGKDIVYFHYLFWPAILLALEIPLPEITTHGFLTVNGQKMSKSRGTFITAKEFNYPAEALRFYYAARLDQKVIDLDLNFSDFIEFNNHVLLGNLGNFCYRVLTFAQKNYGEINTIASDKKITAEINNLIKKIQKGYLKKDFKSAVSNILAIADRGNAYFQKNEPWKNKEQAAGAVGLSVNIARNLAILASPILPEFSRKIFASLGIKAWSWKDLSFIWKGQLNSIEKLVEPLEEHKKEIFPLQLAVGQATSVADHPNADSLLILKVDFGSLGRRQVVTSLKKQLPKSAFENKKLVFCLNLKPAKFRREESTAMIIAAEEGEKITLLEMRASAAGELVLPEGMAANAEVIEFKDFEQVRLEISKERVLFKGKKLKTASEEVVAMGVSDKAKVR
ncbi:MAG TPA: class I tRNA ligase family protein, partial [Candidatus Nanoarchaeia archaeon]|nr:class I tRNA ligase family protein [Candidatus Nanoarchaeia archaeon]